MPLPTVLKGAAQAIVPTVLFVELMVLYAGIPRFPGLYFLLWASFSVMRVHFLQADARERDCQ